MCPNLFGGFRRQPPSVHSPSTLSRDAAPLLALMHTYSSALVADCPVGALPLQAPQQALPAAPFNLVVHHH